MNAKRWTRFFGGAAVLGALALICGDRPLRALPANVGIDPLEVLDLQIKPNVLIVLDSSGSMTETPYSTPALSGQIAGDYQRSKMSLAKDVLNQVIAANIDSASFMLAQYKQSGSRLTEQAPVVNSTTANRFTYTTESWAGAALPQGPGQSLATTDLTVSPLYAYQDIQAAWNTLRYQENNGGTTVTCTATVPVLFYQTGASLATAIQAAMNVPPATCTGGTRANTYTVTYTGSTFSFARATASCSPTPCGTRQFRLVWSSPLSTIRAVLRAPSNAPAPAWNTNPNPPSAQVFVDQGLGNGPFVTADARIMLLTRASTDSFIQTYDPDGTAGASPSRDVRHYLLRANRLWNGQTVSVTSAGLVCGITNGAPASAPTVPFVRLQQVATGCGATVGAPVAFYYAGGNFTGNQQCVDNAADNADMLDVHLNRCDDPDTTLQLAAVQTSLRPELLLSGSGIAGYSESNDGIFMGITAPTVGGIPAQGNTPIAGSLRRIKDRFDVMWASDQTPGTLQLPTDTLVVPAPASRYDIDAISTHNNPKEPTIVIFVTDGDDTCAIESGATNNNALAAAWQAQRLYTPIVGSLLANGQYTAGTDTASSVTTYVVGFGSGASVTRLNWIAWGGSGMQRATTTQNHYNRVPTDSVTRWLTTPPASAIAAGCVTCRDALVAPDADSLKSVLFSIINQGAKQGAFAAQQSVSDSVFEYVDEVTKPVNQDALDPRNPDNRFQGVVPVRFESSFTLPGFEGHLRAITASDDGLTGVTRWDAGRKLKRNIIAGMKTCTAAQTGTCTYPQLHAGANDANVSTSSAAIKRRIYTTGRNGVFDTTVNNLTDINFARGTGQTASDRRRALWPPEAFVTAGSLDSALGIATLTITQLQATPYFACMGTPLLAAGCGSGTAATKLNAARKEAREMILAYLAGAEVERDNVGFPLRITTAAAGQAVSDIRYKVRSWPLNESTLSTPAVVAPPLLAEPGLAVPEYALFRDGARNISTQKIADAVELGFGLRNPDRDSTATIPTGSTTHGVDTRAAQKPPMTIVFVGANDMLHAFRAGPNCAAGGLIDASASVDLNAVQPTMPAGCSELGGEELWGFVPYDQLAKVKNLLIPVTRDPHTYVIASSIRFADVFVPGAFSKTIGSTTTATAAGTGVWRKVLYFGRGAAGRYLTALDITATGPFTKTALTTNGPIALWSRGNPDTYDGTTGGTRNNNNADYNAYLRMGQTWSVPSIAWTDRAYNVTPRAGEFDFVAYVGSGFSDTCPAPSVGSCSEGKALYTLDALTGDVVAVTGDVTTRGGISAYQNAIVAPPSAFSVATTSFSAAEDGGHPSQGKVTRVYFGDLHGFTWKVNSATPGTLILLEDLQSGAGLSNQPQPVTTGAALINLPATGSSSPRPHIYFESGNLKLGDPPVPTNKFQMFGIVDNQTDDTSSTPNSDILPGFPINFDPAGQNSKIPPFRGTAQPTTVFERDPNNTVTGLGRVFFTGTRFNPPGSPEAPDPFPCRSSFDSVVYVVGAETGVAAFDLSAVPNGGSNDQYVVFKDSRLLGVQLAPDVRSTNASATTVRLDEGLVKTDATGEPIVKAPAPKGIQPINVARVSTEGAFSASTICQ